MIEKIQYEFTTKVWQYSGQNGWFFVTLPIEIGSEIRENLQWQEEGWGRMNAVAKIGELKWDTSIWYDKKRKSYLLPLKANIRKKVKIENDQEISVIIWV